MKVELVHFDRLNELEHVIDSWSLWRASRNNAQLSRELPYVEGGYNNFFKSYRRLSHIAKTAGSHALAPYVIHARDDHGEHAVGIATIQAHLPEPNPTPFTQAIEFSYWHYDMKPVMAARVGKNIIDKLIHRSLDSRLFGEERNAAWMVTLPDDEIKASVCQTTGFNRVADPAQYYIGDAVTEDRQLWAATLDHPRLI